MSRRGTTSAWEKLNSKILMKITENFWVRNLNLKKLNLPELFWRF
jgi:hypothetical protein